MNRRDFFKNTATAAVAATAPGLVLGSLPDTRAPGKEFWLHDWGYAEDRLQPYLRVIHVKADGSRSTAVYRFDTIFCHRDLTPKAKSEWVEYLKSTLAEMD